MESDASHDKDLTPELFKFSLISPLIHLDDKEDRQNIVQSITGKELDIPDSGKKTLTPKTVSNYLKRYENSGFAGLKGRIGATKVNPKQYRKMFS